jgi:tRNA threonylcarbamoyladenosine biosynthesis protein TsaE
MKHRIEIPRLEEIDAAARRFLKETPRHRLIAFHAPMGAGKTTFTAALCRAKGVREDAVSSPTFAIINEYRTADGEPLFHFDFYRITRLEEALDIGLYDYLDSGCLCLMEWPENVAELLPEDTLHVDIAVKEDGTRVLTWEDE